MPTELLTRASLPADSAESGYLAPGVKSRQKPTVRHDNASFGDFLNLFNPLNMIPGVSSLSAAATGQKTPAISSLVGGAIFGGPLGVMIAGLSMMFEEVTGKGIVGSVADAVTGNTPAQVAQADQPRDYAAYYSSIANAHKPDYLRVSESA